MSFSRNIPQLYINEFFDSIQGEGALAGYRTLFIRTQGCHIGCKWCDTKKSWKQSDKHKNKALDIYQNIKDNINPKHWICFTGGEPLEQLSSIKWLIEKLNRNGYKKISIETAGLPQPDMIDLIDLFGYGVFFSLSPKLESAIGKRFNYDDLLKMVEFWDKTIYVPFRLQYKFVVSNEYDLKTVDQLLRDFTTDHHLFIQIEHSKLNDKDFVNAVLKLQRENHFYKARVVIQQHSVLGIR